MTYSGYTALALLCLVFLVPHPAHAGVLSFVSELFLGNPASAVVSSAQNSQTMALLAPTRNPDPNASQGGGDVTVVAGAALLAEAGPSGTLADLAVQPATDQISIYVVREGDTLSQIADMFEVSANTILWANDVDSASLIRPGQTLVILPVSGVRHTVKKGDTLASIAKKYGGNVKEIRQFNGFTSDETLAVGDTVVVPHGEAPMPKTPSYVRGSAIAVSSGYFISPIAGGGYRSQGLHGYNAVDIAAPYGTPIVAAATGDVIIVRSGGWNGGYGNYVVIRHGNGTQTLYSHQSRNIVSVGQRVVQGQVIGYVGSTGRSTGAHVHFEVRGARNPFAY